MYSIYGSGHCLSSEHKGTTLSTLMLSFQKRGLCPTEPFNLKKWILAAGVIIFPPQISCTLTICFCKATVRLTTMAFHLSQGWKVNKG